MGVLEHWISVKTTEERFTAREYGSPGKRLPGDPTVVDQATLDVPTTRKAEGAI
jgi:hypothetical protein